MMSAGRVPPGKGSGARDPSVSHRDSLPRKVLGHIPHRAHRALYSSTRVQIWCPLHAHPPLGLAGTSANVQGTRAGTHTPHFEWPLAMQSATHACSCPYGAPCSLMHSARALSLRENDLCGRSHEHACNHALAMRLRQARALHHYVCSVVL